MAQNISDNNHFLLLVNSSHHGMFKNLEQAQSAAIRRNAGVPLVWRQVNGSTWGAEGSMKTFIVVNLAPVREVLKKPVAA